MQAADSATLVIKLPDACRLYQKCENYKGRNISVFSLPWDIIAEGMHVIDLLQLEQTCKYFRDFIKNRKALWQRASYYNVWPRYSCLRHFERGAKAGNIEALTKMALAYLYHEGLSPLVRDEDQKVQICGEKAAEMFATLESLVPGMNPFTWIFFRPPWSTVLSAKKVAFEEVQRKVSKVERDNLNLAVSCAAALDLMGTEQAQAEAQVLLEKAAQAGSLQARFSLVVKKYAEAKTSNDPGMELARVRELRAIVEQGCPEARLMLAKWYAEGCTGGMDQQHVLSFIQSVFHCPHAGRAAGPVAAKGQMTSAIRYILIDWLIEVATIKDLNSNLVHMAVGLMDRFLRRREVLRSTLQLLGISAMVLSSRFIGQEIITIREASWLTDSTYNYDEVVHMITEVVATVKGIVKVPTVLDYMEILCAALDMTKADCYLATYISEMCLLHADLGRFCAKQTAAGCVMLAQLIQRVDCPWPTVVEDYTQFSKHNVASVASAIYKKCYKEKPIVDHRNVALVAVKTRFAASKYHQVSAIEIDEEHDDWILCQLTEFIHEAACKEEAELADRQGMMIFSPCRNPGKAAHRRKRRECECSTPDNSSDNIHDVSDVDVSISELPPDGQDNALLELPNSQDSSSFKSIPYWVPNVPFCSSPEPVSPPRQPLNWPLNVSPSPPEASSSSNSDSDDDDLAARLLPSSTDGNGPSSSSGCQENAWSTACHPTAGESATLHTQGGSDSGPLALVSAVGMPERSSTLPAFIQQMHLLQQQATGDVSSQLSSAEISLAQPGFSGAELSTTTKSVCDYKEQNALEACGQQLIENGFQQLQQNDPLKGRREGGGCGNSLLPPEPSSAEGKGQRGDKGRKRSCSPGEGTSGLGQLESERSVCKLRRIRQPQQKGQQTQGRGF